MLNITNTSSVERMDIEANSTRDFKYEPNDKAVAELVPFSVAIVLVNMFVFILFIKKKTLRTPANYLLLSLAGCDFFTGCVNIPIALMAFTQIVPYPKLSDLFYLVAVLHQFTAVSTGYHILVITFERYLAFIWDVTRPASKNAIFKVLSAVWGVSAIIAFVPFFWKTELHKQNPKALNLQISHAIFCLAAVFVLPYTFMIYAYTNMFKAIKKARQQRQLEQTWRSERKRIEQRCLLIFVTMGTLYLVCWLPWFTWTVVLIVNTSAANEVHATISQVLVLVRYSTSVLNPILYTFFKNDFFIAFKQVILRRGLDERVSLSALETARQSSGDDYDDV